MSEQDEMDSPVLDALAHAVEPVEPPAALRERILAASREGGEVVPIRRVPPRPPRLRVPLGAVAAMLVVALVAGFLVGDAIGHGTTPPPASTTHFSLQGHGPLSAASASVVDVRSEGVAVVTFAGLPELPPGKVYELWLITSSSHADAAGVFVPDFTGGAVVAVQRSLAGYKLMAVTIETGPSGVSSPTQQPEIYGTVT